MAKLKLRSNVLIGVALWVFAIFVTPVWAHNSLEICNKALLSVQERLDRRNEEISSRWARKLNELGIPQTGTIVEVGPGSQPKIGMALQQIGFKGHLIVIEPHVESGLAIQKKYRELMPNALIEVLNIRLEDAPKKIREPISALLSNHVFDDMIIANSFDDQEMQQFFADHYTLEQSIRGTRAAWQKLMSDPARLAQTKSAIANEWLRVVEALNPNHLVVLQYNSLFFQENAIDDPDREARSIMPVLEMRLNGAGVATHTQGDWLVGRLLPGAVKRLGEKTFVLTMVEPIPAKDVEVVVADKKSLSGRGLKTDLGNLKKIFAWRVTESPGADARLAWVDYQADPTKIALSGNEGSGRAVYLGPDFNLKGVGRTPLAKADPSDEHGTGLQPIYMSLWESIWTPFLKRNTSYGTAEIPVVLLRKDAQAMGSKAAIVVRIDEGKLDRPTHAMLPQYAGQNVDLVDVGRRFGTQEADKFAFRMMQGAFSAGNIALDGATLDLEIASSVIGRHSQFSLTKNWRPNFFGTEIEGQAMVLSTMARALKIPKEKLAEANTAMYQAFHSRLRVAFLRLMGFPESAFSTLNADQIASLTQLSATFNRLSRLMFQDWNGIKRQEMGVHPGSQVFDFSRFFRLFPILQSAGESNNKELLELMRHTPLLTRTKGRIDLKTPINDWLESLTIKTSLKLKLVEFEALQFIKDYKKLYSSLRPQASVAFEAYANNQDQIYLSGGYGKSFVGNLTQEYSTGRITIQKLRRYMTWLRQIAAPEEPETAILDPMILNDGMVYRRWKSPSTHQIGLQVLEKYSRGSECVLQVGNRELRMVAGEQRDGVTEFLSEPLPNSMMLTFRTKLGSLKCGKFEFKLELPSFNDSENPNFAFYLEN